MKQSTSFAQVATNLLNVLQGYTKGIRLVVVLTMLLVVGIGQTWGADFNTKYTYSMLGDSWSLTNCEDVSSYWKVPKDTEKASIACCTGIFSNKTITSDVVITLDIATFGNGTNPSASKFTIYNSYECSSLVTATQGGTLPSSSTYTTATYTIAKNEAVEKFTTDLAIKVAKGTKQIRLRSISIKFSYENAAPAVKHKAYFYNGTTLLNAGGTEFAEGAAVSYSGSTPTSCDGESVTFVGWATSTWDGKVAKGDIVPDFYNIIDGEDLPEMGTADVNYYAVFAKETTKSGESRDVIDVINNSVTYEKLGNSGTTVWVSPWETNAMPSGAKYKVYSMGLNKATDYALQWNKNGYLFTSQAPNDGLKLKSITIKTNDAETINLFGSTTAYTSQATSTSLNSLSTQANTNATYSLTDAQKPNFLRCLL